MLESLIALRGRKVFKDFGSMEAPEKLSGVVLEESQEARQTKSLSKGGLAKDLEVESDGEDVVDRLDELAIAPSRSIRDRERE